MATTLLTLMEQLPLEPLVALDFATAVSNLSFYAPFVEDLLSVAPGALLRCCLRILRRREDALRVTSPNGMDSTGPRRRVGSAKRSVPSDHMAVQELSMVEEDFAVLLRNISSFPALAQVCAPTRHDAVSNSVRATSSQMIVKQWLRTRTGCWNACSAEACMQVRGIESGSGALVNPTPLPITTPCAQQSERCYVQLLRNSGLRTLPERQVPPSASCGCRLS